MGAAIELITAIAENPVRILLDIARRPILLGAVILGFVASAVVCLVLSAVMFQGWWGSFLQGVGVSLLFVGVVQLGILGALSGLVHGSSVEVSTFNTTAANGSNHIVLSWP